MKVSNKNRMKTGFLKPETRNLKPEIDSRYPASSIRPFIVPIFLPHAGCPHQCVFCNQVAITGSRPKAVNSDQIRYQIQQFLGHNNGRRKPVQISFFGGNFLGLKTDEIILLLDLATEYVRQGRVDSIRFSTRPDTITAERLELIAEYPVETVELGVQSMDDEVLALARRGHDAAGVSNAVYRLKAHDYEIGLQMMVGLPGDTQALSMISAEKIAALRPDFVRIYPTIVVKNSRLAEWYLNGTYTPLSLDDAVALVKNLFLYFKKLNIRIIRMGLQASQDLAAESTVLAGPYHPAFGHMVYSAVFYDAAQKAIDSMKSLSETITIAVNPRSIPQMRGLANLNIKKLKERYHFKAIKIVPDAFLAAEELTVR
jgi:histone acetyltransferase (RNA polymerase elongator complex component)